MRKKLKLIDSFDVSQTNQFVGYHYNTHTTQIESSSKFKFVVTVGVGNPHY